ncbi:MAG: right-handed parallel beta-helix repeat-containing protein [Thermodesulfobacteriota bacterium]
MASHPNTRPAWIERPGRSWPGLALAGILGLAAACDRQPTLELGKTVLGQDTTWTGTVVLAGDVEIPPGITLTIAPGTTVRFRKIDEKSDQNLYVPDSPYYPQAELIVRGRLLAEGQPGQAIVFTSAAADAQPADWGAINFLGSAGSVIRHAKILCAYNGVHAHGSQLRIEDSEFVKNGVAISFKREEETPGVPWFGRDSDLVIAGNLITRNKGGITGRNARAEIAHNEIRDNKFFGIWPKEDSPMFIHHNEITGSKKGLYLYQARGLRVESNNIYDNTDYDIGVAEAQDYPVDARGNWLGTTDPARIAERIFDHADDPELAEILALPALTAPVAWEKKR